MKPSVIYCLLLVMAFPAAAQEKLETDPFDLSSAQDKVSELGIVTKSGVDALENQARELFNAGSCTQAIPVLEDYAKKANWLANLIAQGLEPYYGASYDDRKDYPPAKARNLIPMERMANSYKQKRNIAFAMLGECHITNGDKETAIPVLFRALDLISVDNETWWFRTRDNLYSIVEVSF